MNPVLDAVFGNHSAAQALLFIEAYGSGHPSRIASTFELPLTGVYRQLKRLETNGVLISRTVGKTRVFEFNIRNPTVRRLRDFLSAELEALPAEELKRFYRQRQRPRRTGKAM